MGPATLAIVIVILLLIMSISGFLAYQLTSSSPPKSTRYGSQALLNLLDVYQSWHESTSDTPTEYHLLPGNQIQVGYWDTGYLIGMSTYLASYTILDQFTIRIDLIKALKVLDHSPPASITLRYINDRQLQETRTINGQTVTRTLVN